MYSAIKANKRNTFIIMLVFILLISTIAFLVGSLAHNYSISAFVIGIALIYATIEYFMASRLAISLSGGHEITKQDDLLLWNTVENLAITAGLPMPRVFIIDDPAPNAFATGRDPRHSYVAATTGLLKIMNKRELTAVMAHEMSHIQNYDIRVSMIVFGLVSAIGLLSDLAWRLFYSSSRDDNDRTTVIGLVILSVVAPIVAGLTHLAISRQREYLADSSGMLLSRDPDGMISALTKLDQYGKPMQKQNSSMAHLYINNPLKKNFISKIFSTHPPIEDRINRLQKMGGRM